jgi:hypothetical protein
MENLLHSVNVGKETSCPPLLNRLGSELHRVSK